MHFENWTIASVADIHCMIDDEPVIQILWQYQVTVTLLQWTVLQFYVIMHFVNIYKCTFFNQENFKKISLYSSWTQNLSN